MSRYDDELRKMSDTGFYASILKSSLVGPVEQSYAGKVLAPGELEAIAVAADRLDLKVSWRHDANGDRIGTFTRIVERT